MSFPRTGTSAERHDRVARVAHSSSLASAQNGNNQLLNPIFTNTLYETRTRNGTMKNHPLPVLRINGNLRFIKADIEAWLVKFGERQAA
jgi:hypothetical protein